MIKQLLQLHSCSFLRTKTNRDSTFLPFSLYLCQGQGWYAQNILSASYYFNLKVIKRLFYSRQKIHRDDKTAATNFILADFLEQKTNRDSTIFAIFSLPMPGAGIVFTRRLVKLLLL
jgi:hypothetical protein